jgi:hypothetical protein
MTDLKIKLNMVKGISRPKFFYLGPPIFNSTLALSNFFGLYMRRTISSTFVVPLMFVPNLA